MFNPVVFYLTTVVMILFAILAIKFKNIFYSLLSAIVVFFLAGVVFYLLGSEYNAVIQIAIYGVAVPVILGLAIMFTNLKKDDSKSEKNTSNLKYVILLTSGIFILALIYLIMISLVFNPNGFNISEEINLNYIQVMRAFSHGIFVKYVWAFELVSLILTMIVAGLTLFNTKKKELEECKK